MNIKEMGVVLSLNKCIEIAEGTTSMLKKQLKGCRTPTRKRELKNTLEIIEAYAYHLNRLKNIESGNDK